MIFPSDFNCWGGYFDDFDEQARFGPLLHLITFPCLRLLFSCLGRFFKARKSFHFSLFLLLGLNPVHQFL
jgi:hypothetical protein